MGVPNLSRYKLELPDEEELATELRREIKRLAVAEDNGHFMSNPD